MKPETEQFLTKARSSLAEARAMSDARLAEAAGRTAYFAAFHAAQALLFERESRVVKTHNGVHTEWQRLTRDDAGVDGTCADSCRGASASRSRRITVWIRSTV